MPRRHPPLRLDDRDLRPESLMMSHGYKPELSEGAKAYHATPRSGVP